MLGMDMNFDAPRPARRSTQQPAKIKYLAKSEINANYKHHLLPRPDTRDINEA